MRVPSSSALRRAAARYATSTLRAASRWAPSRRAAASSFAASGRCHQGRAARTACHAWRAARSWRARSAAGSAPIRFSTLSSR
ncbi:hypothetical protein WJ974_06285 [Achromobacter xylosoxidans]